MDRYSYREGGDGIEGIGYGKKRMLPCNVDDRVENRWRFLAKTCPSLSYGRST